MKAHTGVIFHVNPEIYLVPTYLISWFVRNTGGIQVLFWDRPQCWYIDTDFQ